MRTNGTDSGNLQFWGQKKPEWWGSQEIELQ